MRHRCTCTGQLTVFQRQAPMVVRHTELFSSGRNARLKGLDILQPSSKPTYRQPQRGARADVLDSRRLFLPKFRATEDRSRPIRAVRSEEHTSELQSLMRISYAVFCLK